MIIKTLIIGLSIKIGPDGVCILTSASTGRHGSLDLTNYANNCKEEITKKAILDWCTETTKLFSK